MKLISLLVAPVKSVIWPMLVEFKNELKAELIEDIQDQMQYSTAYLAEEAAEAANIAGGQAAATYSSLRQKAATKIFSGSPDLVLAYPLLKRALLRKFQGNTAVAQAAKVKQLVLKLQELTPEEANAIVTELLDRAMDIISDRFMGDDEAEPNAPE